MPPRVRLTLSIRHKLALLITGVALAVIALSGVSAYREMTSSAILEAGQRLESVARELADAVAAGSPSPQRQVTALAADAAVRSHLRAAGRRSADSARAALARPAASAANVAAVELWDAGARRLVSTRDSLPPLPDHLARDLAGLVAERDSTAIGWIFAEGDSLRYAVIAPVREGGTVRGYVAQRRRLASSASGAKLLRDLIGSDARLLVGNTRGDLWSDFTKTAPPPPAAVPRQGGHLEYPREDGTDVLAHFAPIAGTPWMLAVEFPSVTVLAPARAVLGRIALFSLVLLLAAGAGAWTLSAGLTRPIAELVTATEALSAGDYARRVTVARTDELGALGEAFNRMADRITDSRDRLERKALEAATSEARLEHLIGSSGAVLYDLQRAGGELLPDWVSENVTRVFGYSTTETLSRTWWTEHVHPEDLARMTEPPGAGRFFEGTREYRLRDKSGAWRWVSDEQHVRRDDAGIVLEVVGTWLDITEHRELEEQLRHAQKMEAVGRLAGGVAHDFNNLLTVISSYCDLVLLELAQNDPKRPELLEIRGAADRAAVLARQMLTFSRKQVIVPRALDLNEVVRSLHGMTDRLVPPEVQKSRHLAPDLGAITADVGQIEQVLLNLIINAADAMPEGGRLAIETANVQLDAEYATHHAGVTPGEYVMVLVTDTGAGMDRQTLDRIFEPFFTTKPLGKGTGLGLSTAYGIITQAGGHVWVYSEPGHGTTFKLYFPRVYEEVSKPRDVPAGTPPPGAKRATETVLVVEDEPSVLATLTRILQRQGYTVLPASHGGEAMRVAAETSAPIHLVISDLTMPEMTGREFIQRFSAARPHARVLFMSGYTSDEALRRELLDQRQAFIEKPFTVEQITRKVREVLEQPVLR